MGYYTYFTIEVIPDQPDDLPQVFKDVTDIDFTELSNDSIKWYDYQSNMSDISRKYPNHVFKLTGDGEDYDDKWQAVFVNGNYQQVYAELIYPTINISAIDNIGQRCPELFI